MSRPGLKIREALARGPGYRDRMEVARELFHARRRHGRGAPALETSRQELSRVLAKTAPQP